MKLYELTSGVIAAVLIALGAYQYANKAMVEEESVVEEEIVTNPSNTLDDIWYEFTMPDEGTYEDAILDPENYSPYNLGEEDDPDCQIGNEVCAVKLPEQTGDHPSQSDLNLIEDYLDGTLTDYDQVVFRN